MLCAAAGRLLFQIYGAFSKNLETGRQQGGGLGTQDHYPQERIVKIGLQALLQK